jgi:hypothetical protein
MSDSLEQAAMAFDSALGNTAPSEKAPASSGQPTEMLFNNLGDLEVDEESPAKGGGDDIPNPKVRTKAVEVEDDEDDEPETLFKQVADDDQDGEDADPDADEDADGEDKKDDEEEEEDDSDVYEVTVDGERVEVSLREALDGYIRGETFHRRLSKLNEMQGVLKTEAVEVINQRQKYTNLIEQMEAHLDKLIPPEPDWDKEYEADPKAARALEQKYAEIKRTRAALESEKQKVTQEQKEQDEKALKEFIAENNVKILQNNPTWKDTKVMERDLSSMMKTGLKAGFSKEEVLEVYDHRMITVLLKAAKYDRLQDNKPKPVRRGGKPIKPGAGSKSTAPKVSTAMNSLSRTGSVDDAAGVMLSLINQKTRRK